MTDPTRLSLAAAAAHLAAGDLTARELVDACLTRIAATAGHLGAFVAVDAEAARRAADGSDRRRADGRPLGPLDGIPVGVKDNIDVAGFVTSNGGNPAGRPVAVADAFVVAALRAGGAIPLGKLNLHEGALGATTDNPFLGRCHNPWRHGHTAGGSSGGSGAAVAARLVPGALGSDTMGSVRLPAAYCGVVGLKPTYGVFSNTGVAALAVWLDTVGPLARTVDDVALLFDAMASFDPDWGGAVAAPAVPPAVPERPRFAVLENFDSVPQQAEVRAGFELALAAVEARYGPVRTCRIDGYVPSVSRRAGLLISEADGWVAHEALLEAVPDCHSEAYRSMLRFGRDVPAVKLTRALRSIEHAGFGLNRLLREVDVLIAPTAAETAFPFGQPAPVSQADITGLANFAGCPALQLPCGTGGGDLPVGVQLVAAAHRENLLFAVGRELEAVLPRLPEPPDCGG